MKSLSSLLITDLIDFHSKIESIKKDKLVENKEYKEFIIELLENCVDKIENKLKDKKQRRSKLNFIG